jgi:guanylate kinase
VLDPLAAGQNLVISVDVQGVESFRRAAAADPRLATAMTTVFIVVERERLVSRMRHRAKEQRA